jgi:hypothetical protein
MLTKWRGGRRPIPIILGYHEAIGQNTPILSGEPQLRTSTARLRISVPCSTPPCATPAVYLMRNYITTLSQHGSISDERTNPSSATPLRLGIPKSKLPRSPTPRHQRPRQTILLDSYLRQLTPRDPTYHQQGQVSSSTSSLLTRLPISHQTTGTSRKCRPNPSGSLSIRTGRMLLTGYL